MAWTIKRTIDLQKGDLHQNGRTVGILSYPGDADAHIWEITVLDGGEPATLSGTATAYFKRSHDGNSVVQTGTVTGNVVTITIPAGAYAYQGLVTAIARLTVPSTSTVTIDAIAFTVGENATETIVDPGNVVDVDDILAEYADMLAATEACEQATATAEQFTNIIAPAYSTSETYAFGDYVTYNGDVYRCKQAITTAEAWTSGHWEETSAGAEIRKAVLAGVIHADTYADLTALTGDGTLGNLPLNRIYYISSDVTTINQEIPDAPFGHFYGTVATFAYGDTRSGAVQVAVMPQTSTEGTLYDVTNVYVRYGFSASWSGWKQLMNEGYAGKRYWEGTPFELIEYEKYERARMIRWNADTATPPAFTKRDVIAGCTRMHRCPRYIGWFINSQSARLTLYIGTVDGSGAFTPDIYINRTGGGIANYLTSSYNQIIDIGDNDHYFYYYKSPDPDNITIIGADEWPESDIDGLAVTPYGRGSYDSSTQTYGVSFATSNNGIMLPAGCAFAVLPPNRITSANQSTCAITTSVGAAGVDRWKRLGAEEIVPFGKIPSGLQGILAAKPGTNTEQCRVYIHKEVHERASGYAEQAHELAKRLNEIPWQVAATRYMRHAYSASDYDADSTYAVDALVRYNAAIYQCRTAITSAEPWTSSHWTKLESISSYVPNKRYHGVPYSGGWGDTHWIGFEISPFTMVSAAADEYSIFYDTTEGRSAIPSNDGPGMGLVCSTFGALIMGCPYPQTNRGMTWDDNFVCLPETKAIAGGLYTSGDHVLFVDEAMDDGVATYEQHAIGTGKYFYNADGTSTAMAGYTRRSRMYDYIYRAMPGWYTAGAYDGFYTDTTNLTPVNGTVRPWRGNKSVTGPYDITKYGGIFVTIHEASGGATPTVIKLVKPGALSAIDIPIPSGATVVDITSAVTADGTYTLYSDADSTTKEYFRYRSHDPVTFSFTERGICTFSALDVDYCYGRGTGHSIPAMDDQRTAFIVFGKGVGYKRLIDAGMLDTGCGAAMVRDPGDANDPTGDTGSWGRYSVACSYSEG